MATYSIWWFSIVRLPSCALSDLIPFPQVSPEHIRHWNECWGQDLQKQPFPLPKHLIWIIFYGPDVEDLLGHFHEPQICPPPLLEAEIAHCLFPNQVLHRSQQKWKCGLEVDTIGCKKDVWERGYRGRNVRSPWEDGGDDRRKEGVQGDVFREKGKHGCKIGYVDRSEVSGVKAKGETVRAGVLMSNNCFTFELEDEVPNKATTGT